MFPWRQPITTVGIRSICLQVIKNLRRCVQQLSLEYVDEEVTMLLRLPFSQVAVCRLTVLLLLLSFSQGSYLQSVRYHMMAHHSQQ